MSEKCTLDELQKKLEQLFVEEPNVAEKHITERYDLQRDKLKNFVKDNFDDKFTTTKETDFPSAFSENLPFRIGVDPTVPPIDNNGIREIKSSVVFPLSDILKDDVIKKIDELYNIILICVKNYLNGQFEDSLEVLKSGFIEFNLYKPQLLGSELFNSAFIDVGREFYRIRDNDTYMLYTPSEMFHIPFEKRGKTTNQRFSMSGYPCLYLGESIYGCWEETKRPNIDIFNVIALRNTTPLMFVNLDIPNISESNRYCAEWIWSLVLRLSCSLRINNPEDHFKPEYIIPQSVLSFVVKHNKENGKHFGVCYTSTTYKQTHDMFNKKKLLLNYVIPIKESEKKGLCQTLLNAFEVSEVTSLTNERVKKDIGDIGRWQEIGEDTQENIYLTTEFGDLEEIIKTKIHTKID